MTPSWYDVLGVEPSADAEEIRAAWRTAIADLDPGDRRFRALNQAAEVLLDPDRRAQHDADLAADLASDLAAEPSQADEDAAAVPAEETPPVAVAAPRAGTGIDDPGVDAPSVVRGRGVPTWALLVAGVAAIALFVTAVVLGFTGGSSNTIDDAAADQAEQAAVRAIAPVLSYDYRHLDEDAAAARTYMTASYQKQYDQTFAVVKENAPGLKAVVSAEVIDAGIVRTGPDRVEVLVFVNRPTSNKRTSAPVVFKDQVTVTMVREGGDWLVDDLATS